MVPGLSFDIKSRAKVSNVMGVDLSQHKYIIGSFAARPCSQGPRFKVIRRKKACKEELKEAEAWTGIWKDDAFTWSGILETSLLISLLISLIIFTVYTWPSLTITLPLYKQIQPPVPQISILPIRTSVFS